MSKIRQRFLPSIQTMELMSPLAQSLSAAEIVARVSSFGYYRAAETAVVCDAAVSARLGAVCADAGLYWLCWASPFINGEGLNISSLDSEVWEYSVSRLTELLKTAAGAGANAFAFLSGPRPEDPGRLTEALGRLEEGMLRLADCAGRYPGFRLLIEPLDRDIHKHGTLGTSQEAAALIRSVRKAHAESFIVWDSAHFALQEGDLSASLQTCGDAIGHIHLCNAVLDRDHPLYGDYHIMPGGAGYLDEASAARILAQAAACPMIPDVVPVAVEARPAADAWGAEEETRRFLERAFDGAEKLFG